MEEILKRRTKNIGVQVIIMIDALKFSPAQKVIANQIIKSATSIGANYRAVCREKSDADFINKLRIVEEETDETLYWFEVLEEIGYIKSNELEILKKETNEILSIVVASINTTLKRIQNTNSKKT
jgi:four helix bundle protein